jgi:hypothetical protein
MKNILEDAISTIKPALAALSATQIVVAGFGGRYTFVIEQKGQEQAAYNAPHNQEPGNSADIHHHHTSPRYMDPQRFGQSNHS